MAIYQLRRDAPVGLRFASLGSLVAPPDPANYEAVYTREVYPDDDTGRILENFYYIFNDERPGDFVGHSLSVSDIVALKQDGNTACKEAIEAAIRDHYRDNRLDAAAVDQVVQQFGYDRAFYILAITVCQADWDRRYSPDNRAWANAMSIPANPDAWGTDRNCYLAVSSHPGLVDLFLSQTRKAYAQEQQKTSVRDKLKKLPETRRCLKMAKVGHERQRLFP